MESYFHYPAMNQLWNSSVVLGKLLKTNIFNNIVEEEKRERLELSTRNHFKFNSLRKLQDYAMENGEIFQNNNSSQNSCIVLFFI